MGKKIYLTESELQRIVENATLEVLNERIKSNKKEKINEGNSYKVDFNALGNPLGKTRKGMFGGAYMDNAKTKKAMENGTYGHSGLVDMGAFIEDLKDLGYTPEQIQQGIRSGAIQLRNKRGQQWGARKQNRKFGRLMTKAGGVLGTGSVIGNQQQGQETPVSSGTDSSIAPAPTIQTKTVYYKSDKVKQIQTLLNEKFGTSLNPDGVCGPLTIDAMLNALNNGQGNPATQQNNGTENNPSKEDVAKARAEAPIQKIKTPKATIQTNPETIGTTPKQTGGTIGYQQRMSQVYNDEKMTPDEKINAINTIVANAEKGGYKGSKELRDIANKYINGLKGR